MTALEADEAAIDLTRAEIARHGLDTVDLIIGDVHALKLPEGRFDIVHAHQVLQHVRDPVQALREMRRVCKPGGVVAARDADYAGFVWYPRLPELDQWMCWYQHAARANGGEPDAGRRLLSWARQAGFADITSSSSTWCLATPEARHWWGGMWADRILESALARQLVDSDMATRADLQEISDAWKRWADDGDGWYLVPHGEIIARA